MTDSTNTTPNTGADTGSASDDTFAWTEPDATTGTDTRAREWLAQLQAMIDKLATQAAPVVREVGAKAAELAAIAGEKAGPVAQRAAELTGQAGTKLAERSRDFATELRRDAATAKGDATATASDFEATTETTVPGESNTADEPTASGVV